VRKGGSGRECSRRGKKENRLPISRAKKGTRLCIKRDGKRKSRNMSEKGKRGKKGSKAPRLSSFGGKKNQRA